MVFIVQLYLLREFYGTVFILHSFRLGLAYVVYWKFLGVEAFQALKRVSENIPQCFDHKFLFTGLFMHHVPD